jgi:hypothetical protein
MGRFVLGALLLFVARPALGQDGLTWKWKQGDTFYVSNFNHIKQTLKLEATPGRANGREVSQEFEQAAVFRYSVRAVNKDGSAELGQRVEQVVIRTGDSLTAPIWTLLSRVTMLARFSLDADQTIRSDDSLKGVELVLHVTPRGEVTKVEGADKLLKKLEKLADSSKLKRALIGALPWWMVVVEVVEWSEALRKQATQALGFLPDNPLKKGLRWQRPAGLALGALGHLDGERTYAYDGSPTGKGPVTITFTTVVKGFEPGKGGAEGPRVTRGKIKTAKGEGRLEFDPAAGRLLNAQSRLELDGDITFKDPEGDTEYRGRLTQEHRTQTLVTDKRP